MPADKQAVTERNKGHLDTERLDCVTILPPAAFPCNVSLRQPQHGLSDLLHLIGHDGLPSVDCENPDCLVDSVHEH